MALQGNIDSFSVVDVLRLLGSSAKSGRLVVDGDRGSCSLWMADGRVVGATTAPSGSSPVIAPPSEVLFDLLRFAEGSFIFEADVAPGLDEAAAFGAPTDVESMIVDSEAAVHEWDGIVAVVPSLRSGVALTLDLPTEVVEIDRRAWSGVVAAAAGMARTGDRTTAAAIGEMLALSELPALRLVRDLVAIGLVEVTGEVTEAAHFEPALHSAPVEPNAFDTSTPPGPPVFSPPAFDAPAFEPAPFEPASFEPAGFEHTPFESGPFAPSPFEPVAPEPSAYEPADIDLPAPGTGAPEVPHPIGNIAAPDDFEPFAPFDPFGTATPADDEAGAATESDARVSEEPAAEAMTPEEEAAQQAEFARQLAMLSPRAAEAVASAEAGPSTEDEERARVARFLGSV